MGCPSSSSKVGILNRFAGVEVTVARVAVWRPVTVANHTGGRFARTSWAHYVRSFVLSGREGGHTLYIKIKQDGETRATKIGIGRLGPLVAMRTTVIGTGYLWDYPRVPLVDMMKVGATDDADAAPAVNPMVSPVTYSMTTQTSDFPSSEVQITFSIAAVTSSAAVTVTGVGPGDIGMLVRGPGTTVATGIPVESAKVMERKVEATHRLYEGGGVADAAEVVTSAGIFVASSVRSYAASMMSGIALCFAPTKGISTDSTVQTQAYLRASDRLLPNG